MDAAGLFSGGKDSLYAIYLMEKSGINVKYLIHLIPTFKVPSPHSENIDAVRMLSESTDKKFIIVDLRKGIEYFKDMLKKLEIDFLIAGDVLVEDHVKWLGKICDDIDIKLLEPLYKMDTKQLLYEILKNRFKPVIIGIDTKNMDRKWLGYKLNIENINYFLSENKGIDPVGEYGEYHTIVIESPLYNKKFNIRTIENIERLGISYLKVTVK